MGNITTNRHTLPRAENRRDTLPKEKNDDEDAMKAGTFTVGASTLSGTGVRRIGAAASRSGSAASRLQDKFLTRSRFEVVARAEEEDSKGAMADIGLGDLEDVMEKASGGSTSSDMLPEDLDGLVKFLGSDNVDFAQKLLVEKYGETLYRELGFTSQSETINGRLAMIGFTSGFGGLFGGDILTQFAKSPLPAVLISLAIISATLVPTVKPDGYLPASIKDTVMKLYGDIGGEEIFTPKAEIINGRAAMLGIFALTLLSIIF